MTIAKGTGFVKGNRQAAGKQLTGHLKYLEYRPRGPEETRTDRSLFTEDQDQVTRREALDDILAHSSETIRYHKIVLSPAQDEPVADWKEWTRTIMHDLEDYKDQKLHWYAVKHSNTDDPHIHVVLAGRGESFQTGREKPVKLYTADRAPDGHGDYEFLRERGREHSDHEHYQRLQTIIKELDREDTLSQESRAKTQQQREPPRSSSKEMER